MKININDSVRVRLTECGKKQHRENHDNFWRTTKHPNPPKYTAPVEDVDGWSEWQLWCLMAEFGPHILMGSLPPFDTEIELCGAPANALPAVADA